MQSWLSWADSRRVRSKESKRKIIHSCHARRTNWFVLGAGVLTVAEQIDGEFRQKRCRIWRTRLLFTNLFSGFLSKSLALI
jgi:hypothetical protein